VAVRAHLAPAGIVVGRLQGREDVNRNIAQGLIRLELCTQVVAAARAQRGIGEHQIRATIALGHGQSFLNGLGEAERVARPVHHHGECLLNRATVVCDQDALAHQEPSVIFDNMTGNMGQFREAAIGSASSQTSFGRGRLGTSFEHAIKNPAMMPAPTET